MADERAVTYLKQGLANGHHIKHLKRALIKQGWPHHEVRKAISAVTGWERHHVWLAWLITGILLIIPFIVVAGIIINVTTPSTQAPALLQGKAVCSMPLEGHMVSQHSDPSLVDCALESVMTCQPFSIALQDSSFSSGGNCAMVYESRGRGVLCEFSEHHMDSLVQGRSEHLLGLMVLQQGLLRQVIQGQVLEIPVNGDDVVSCRFINPIEHCNSIADGCYAAQSMYEQSPDPCHHITHEPRREQCLFDVAMRTMDISVCDTLQDAQSCRDFLSFTQGI